MINIRCCVTPIPSAYSGKITYYEELCRLAEEINNIVMDIADINKEIANIGTAWRQDIANAIADLKTYVDQQDQGIYDYIDDQVNIINSKIASVTNIINQQIGIIYRYIDQQDNSLRVWVQVELQKIIDSIPELQNVMVVSPVTGRLQPLQVVLDDMFKWLNFLALTAGEYDALQLTAEEYDSKGLTAWQYDFRARCYLTPSKPECCKMFDPWTGERVDTSSVINKIVDLSFKTSALTAGEYDALELTAQAYDSKQLTAYQYDFTGVTV